MVNALLFLLVIILVVVLSGIYPKQTITTTSFPTEILSRDNTQIKRVSNDYDTNPTYLW